MKYRYKFIHFADDRMLADEAPRWACMNNNNSGHSLGWVIWHPGWSQWTFSANPNAVFSGSCLADIQAFMAQLTAPSLNDVGPPPTNLIDVPTELEGRRMGAK